MSCCGMKRSSLVEPTTRPTATSRPFAADRPAAEARPTAFTPERSPTPAPPPVSPAPGQAPGLVRLRYLARSAILVRGSHSGAAYRFSAQQPVMGVQRADVDPLLATGHFRREG